MVRDKLTYLGRTHQTKSVQKGFIFLVGILILSSCSSTMRLRIKDTDQAPIVKGEIKQVSKVAEYRVVTKKVNGSYSGDYNKKLPNQSLKLAKELAVGNAITTAKCDFLVGPAYDVVIDRKTITVNVNGYPAHYTSFETQTKKDTIIVNEKVVVNTSTPPVPNAVVEKVKKTKKVRHPNNSFYFEVGKSFAAGGLRAPDLFSRGSGINTIVGYKSYSKKKLRTIDKGINIYSSFAILKPTDAGAFVYSGDKTSFSTFGIGRLFGSDINSNSRIDATIGLESSVIFHQDGLLVNDILPAIRPVFHVGYIKKNLLIGASYSGLVISRVDLRFGINF